jgi:TetR/AcrR family transcriptional regulator, fatty acid metabolism regulator protein
MSNHSARAKKRAPADAAAAPGKRERILDAAVRVFAKEGFYGAKVSQIADAAGVADGTIYLYFKSKDELLISLFEDRMDRVLATLRQALASTGGALERLRRVIELHLELIEKNPDMGEVITVELRQSQKFIREYQNPKFAEFLRLIAGAVAEGQKAGELRDDLDPQLTARALFGALDEIALSWLVRAPGEGKRKAARAGGELPRAAHHLATLFLDGLRAPLREAARSK